MDINNPFYHQFETNKSHWSVDYWLSIAPLLRDLKIKSKDLDTHPRIDDVMTLLQIRHELWHRMNNSEQATWGAYWGIVFKKKFVLNKKFWNKFEKITTNIDQREYRQQQQREIVRQLKRTLENTDHNKDAKGSNLAQTLTDKSNNRGATMNLLPWE